MMETSFSQSMSHAASVVAPRPTTTLDTHFASPERASTADIRRQMGILRHVPLLKQALDAMPGMVMILNQNRQIVATNRKLLELLDSTVGELVEKRPGEAIHCIRAQQGPAGCGTSAHCSTCGAVNAVLDSATRHTQSVRECRILASVADQVVPLDLRVTATPFNVEAEVFILVAIEDISHAKRVSVLQRTFFHDVLNTAGCIQGYAEYLAEEMASDSEVCERLTALSDQLIEEIRAQQDLLRAESGDLKPQPTPAKAGPLLEEIRWQYLNHSVALDRTINRGMCCDATFIADRQLVKRVLGNMLKNALEATPPGGTVTISCSDEANTVTFIVNNPGIMPHEVQLQIFQRSFSTKAEAGRGIGTYSMKLLGERYLGGRVDFSSNESDGTTFRLQLPKAPPNAS